MTPEEGGKPPPEPAEAENQTVASLRFSTAVDNQINLGIESLVVAFNSIDYNGENPFAKEGRRVNADKDQSKIPLTRGESPELFEYLDPWGRPYVYFRLSDFEEGKARSQQYHLPDGRLIDVTPIKSDVLGIWAGMSDGFQLISLGPDGEFNTKDDVVSWK